MLLGQFLGCHLRVCGGIGMYDERLHIGHIGQQREDLQGVDKLPGFLLSAVELKGEDTATAIGEILLIESVVLMRGQCGMRDALHAGMLAQIVHHLEGIGHMAFYTQGQTLYTLQQYPCIEGRDG